MADWPPCHDISAAPRRYLQRQWKRNKPHLPPSDSLPALRLYPNRPLFVCAQCGFANAWIPLCLWCEWTSSEATRQFEANLPRPRRLSAPPPRAVVAAKKTRPRPQRMSADSTVWHHTPRCPSRCVPHITTVLGPFHRDVCHGEGRLDTHNVDRHLPGLSTVSAHSRSAQQDTVDGGVHRVATTTSRTPPTPTLSIPFPNVAPKPEARHDSEGRDSKRDSSHHRTRLAALCVRPPSTRCRASCATDERTEPQSAMATPAMDSVTSVLIDASSTPRSTGSVEMSDRGLMHSSSSISLSPCPPKRGLRRTKNMTLLARGSSLSPRSRSPLRESVEIYPTSAVEARQSHALSLHDHDDAPLVRLGHPSRPYYSAIRKDMSRPTSPVFSIATPRTPSPIPSHVDYIPRATKSLDCGDRSGIKYAPELRPMSMVLSGQATSPIARSGCSLSGEMELRMNLARWRRENAPDEPGGYHFRETDRSSRLGVKGRVKQLGKGLKELVLGRASFVASGGWRVT